jgi:hypothetical protein
MGRQTDADVAIRNSRHDLRNTKQKYYIIDYEVRCKCVKPGYELLYLICNRVMNPVITDYVDTLNLKFICQSVISITCICPPRQWFWSRTRVPFWLYSLVHFATHEHPRTPTTGDLIIHTYIQAVLPGSQLNWHVSADWKASVRANVTLIYAIKFISVTSNESTTTSFHIFLN